MLYRGTESLGYSWQWYLVSGYILSVKDGKVISGPLIQGLMVTLHICGWSLVFSFLFGLLTALLRRREPNSSLVRSFEGIAHGVREVVFICSMPFENEK
jgi:ABC-type amino acid transport system permease subunit